MKRCPKCNQEFSESWLTFCTSDGTPLTGTAPPSADYPPPTISMQQPPVTVDQQDRPTMIMPGAAAYGGPVDKWQSAAPPATAPRPAPQWQPAYSSAPPANGLAIASLVLGIFSITLGWCYVGVITAPVGVILGIVSLNQIKKDPTKIGGKGMATAGVVTSAIGVVFVILMFMIIGLSILSNGLK